MDAAETEPVMGKKCIEMEMEMEIEIDDELYGEAIGQSTDKFDPRLPCIGIPT